MGFNLGNIDFSGITNSVSAVDKNAVTSTTGSVSSGAIINPSESSGQLTAEEQKIYEQGIKRIKELCENQRKLNESLFNFGIITKDMVEPTEQNIEAIRNSYEQNHPEYVAARDKIRSKLTPEEQKIYDQGIKRIKELCENQRELNEGLLNSGFITKDMVELTEQNIEAIRNSYVQNHPEYGKVLDKIQKNINNDA